MELWTVYFILLDDGEQVGEMEWCVVEAVDEDSAQERAVDAMEVFYGEDVQWMGTEPYNEEAPEDYPDYLGQIAEGVWV